MMPMLTPFAPRRTGMPRRPRRGIVLLPSIITVGNLFCGYACVVYSMRGELGVAAPFIGVAIILDMLDGRIARFTETTSAFGVEFDSMADMVSFGLAPAVLTFVWGLSALGRVGWAAGFVYVSATAIRLARFNLQTASQVDKRYFLGLPSPAAAGVIAATIFQFPHPITNYPAVLSAAVLVVGPAILMVSRLRFRSFKTINFGRGPSYIPVLMFVLFVALIYSEPQWTLMILAYGYMVSAFVGQVLSRVRAGRSGPPPAASES
jgi:CDP-diacylglycerol--serine O-phosphatidyltransferase